VFNKFMLKIKRKETPFYSYLNYLIKKIFVINIPSIKLIHLPLYYFDFFIRLLVRRLINLFWAVPLFKARCTKVGKGLMLPNGIPLVLGNHLKIYLGNNVVISRTTIGSSKLFDEPVLKIGHNSGIGYGTVISVAKEVIIGDNCMVGPNCIIMDNDDHPISPQKRELDEGVSKKDVLSVKIGNNVWIGANCAILKGVTIGDNSIIATHSVITKNVMENCVYAGYPARPTLRDIHKK